MSWRLVDGDYPRYAVMCPVCSLPRGWVTVERALAAVPGIAATGVVQASALVPEEYRDGEDGTCSHGATLDAPLPPRPPKRRRQ